MFETMLYIAAIVAVLAFFGEPRHTTAEETPAPAADAASEPTTPPAELPTITEPTEPATVTPAPAESTPAPDLQALSVAELRRRATIARYPWRNHHGPNRHASKRELIAALS
jgi:hypothetical protein